MQQPIGIVGAGFSGAVMARELAESGKYSVVVFDERDHVAGNCHSERDRETGILVHQYGPHIFHTPDAEIWRYINRFGAFGPFTNRVKAVTKKGVFSLPLNLLTMNQFFRTRLNPIQAAKFIESLGDRTIVEPQNFEEQALKMMGRDLYENFFYGYTKKQWGMEPSLLPASILQRLPMRFNYDDNYYNSRYQGIPIDGYTAIVEKILDHPAIKIKLKTKYDADMKYDFSHLFFSGPIDAFFDFKLGRLKYRTLKFESFDIDGDFQGNPVINYCEESVQHTRIAEHKHFAPWENHKRSVCFREYSSEMTPGTIPYYPVRLAEDKDLLSKYVGAARETPQVTFIGRLGTYRYLDMHVVIAETLETAKKCLTTSMQEWPVFSNPPLPGVVAGRTKQRAA